jgi:tRNA threonylcarbamoyladenosine biosynthesis protein TsaE
MVAEAPLRIETASPEETAAAGRALASVLDPAAGLFVSLSGPLGAGKTVWVKGAAEGLGIDPAGVASPTFVLASRYEGRAVLVHADLYRIESEDELLAAGFLDWLEPGALVVAEWGDRFPDALPQDRLDVRIERTGGATGRRLEAAARGPIAEAALGRLRAAWGVDAEADARSGD